MAMTSFVIQKSTPFIQHDALEYRLAIMWREDMGRIDYSLPFHATLFDGVLDHQQWLEYENGVPCWIQRKVITQFNTFSTECWV